MVFNKLRIGLIHATINSVSPILKAFSSHQDEVEVLNFMDEGLIFELNKTNTVTTRMVMRLSELAGKADESNVDGILFTCSSFTPYVGKIAQLFSVPVLSSDISFLQLAIERGSKIGVIATVEAAGPTTTSILYNLADEKGKEIKVETHVIKEAFLALQNGDAAEHDRLIQSKISDLKSQEIIVLAQYSMARAIQPMINPPHNVLIGPTVSAQAIIQQAKDYRRKMRL